MFWIMRYAAYCRVSTGSDEQLNSLVNQRRFFGEYVRKRNDVLVKINADRGISGKRRKQRKEFMKLHEDSTKGEFDAVLVKDISRFARNTLDFLTGIRTLKANGVDVVFVGANQKVIGESEFVLTLFAALAQEESCALSKRIIFGKKQGAREGRVPNCIYGYEKSDTYSLVVNPSEADTVQKIYAMYVLENKGLRKIASKLNEEGVPSKCKGRWNPKTVGRILENPIYAGILVNNKTETVDFLLGQKRIVPEEERFHHQRPHMAIVTKEMYDKAQAIRQGRNGGNLEKSP